MKELVRGLLISLAVAAAFFAAFVAAALWVPQDQPTIRRHVVAAVLDGTFNAHFAYGPFGGLVWPRHTMDCVIGSMVLAPPAGRLIDAMSNRWPVVNTSWHDPRVPDTLDCQAFARALPELAPAYGDVQFVPLDRYIMGIRVFARAMLSIMRFDVAANVMRGVAFALLGVIGLTALWKLRGARAGGPSPLLPAGYLVITGCLALLYGVHYFDATFFFAPPDYVHFTFILISLTCPLARMRPGGLAVYAASYGSLTAIFETLTGGIPFALAMLPLLLALGYGGGWRTFLAKLIQLWACFCVAVLACFAIKQGFTILFLNDQESFLYFLLHRMYGEPPPASGTKLTLGYLLRAYRLWSKLIAFGSANTGTGLVLTSLAVFLVQTWRARKLPWCSERTISIAGWLGVGVLILWSAAFLNHTAVHPYFMARLLVIPVIGATLLILAHVLGARQRRPETGSHASVGSPI
jgi:hypothetical protein